MAREDIEKMIADAIGAAEEPCKPAGSKRLPHAQHILDQYAALCRAGECEEAEPSGEVELPVTASDPAGARSSTDPVPSFTKRMLKRIKR